MSCVCSNYSFENSQIHKFHIWLVTMASQYSKFTYFLHEPIQSVFPKPHLSQIEPLQLFLLVYFLHALLWHVSLTHNIWEWNLASQFGRNSFFLVKWRGCCTSRVVHILFFFIKFFSKKYLISVRMLHYKLNTHRVSFHHEQLQYVFSNYNPQQT